MTTKHMPGPWDFTSDGDGKPFAIVTSTHDATGPDDDVCEVYGGNDDCDETREANARLIAAAPDLHDFAATCESIGEEQLAAMDLSLALDTLRTMRALASAAIAKARGEG